MQVRFLQAEKLDLSVIHVYIIILKTIRKGFFMIKRNDLVNFLDSTLKLPDFKSDVSNNGLQVEGNENIERILFGVDACQELFDAAIQTGSQFIFVHHGISWGGGIKRWTGINAKRFSALFRHGISLYAAHLPLDAHPEYGNNTVLSDMIGLEKRKPFFEYSGTHIGFSGVLPQAATCDEIAAIYAENLEITPLLRGPSDRMIRSVAVVSGGGGQDALFAAKEAGCDLLVTGEMEHIMHHIAAELELSVIALGHYASETTGPLAMQKLVGETFDVETLFAEIPTGL